LRVPLSRIGMDVHPDARGDGLMACASAGGTSLHSRRNLIAEVRGAANHTRAIAAKHGCVCAPQSVVSRGGERDGQGRFPTLPPGQVR
jgi:hypothetical protein